MILLQLRLAGALLPPPAPAASSQPRAPPVCSEPSRDRGLAEAGAVPSCRRPHSGGAYPVFGGQAHEPGCLDSRVTVTDAGKDQVWCHTPLEG